ncbi:MAG: OB-fold nucleic acid binding domain-containing protein [Candidatus Korarchaeum sp.]|jgi:RPA family protein|nr:OB-fold nucleic acid binding domain-containing protein [Candidatus Korarchaeum sp.]
MRIEAAQKVRIKELLAGEFEEVSVDGTRYFRLPWGSVSRVRIMGLVLDSSMKEDGSFATLELHDGTASIQVKAWDEDVNLLMDPDTGRIYGAGSIIDLIGKVKSWKDSIYLSPILVIKVRDPNAILLRELEILRRELRLRGKPKLKDSKEDMKVIIRALKDLGPLSAEEIADLLKEEVEDVRKLLGEMVTSGLLYESGGKYSYVGQR